MVRLNLFLWIVEGIFTCDYRIKLIDQEIGTKGKLKVEGGK